MSRTLPILYHIHTIPNKAFLAGLLGSGALWELANSPFEEPSQR